jgi:hypothetical protein
MPFAEVGFPSLKRRLMEKTTPEKIRQFLEYLGQRVREAHRLNVAGAVALIVPGYLERKTEDVDVVDEIPKEIRENQKLTDELEQVFALHLGHVQSHYLPRNWIDRVHYLNRFGRVEVYLLDVYDVFLSKLFSERVKDIQDLTVLIRKIDKETVKARLQTDCASFLTDSGLKQMAVNNWKVLYGEDLPQ